MTSSHSAGPFQFIEDVRLRRNRDPDFVEGIRRVRSRLAAARPTYPRIDLEALARAVGIAEVRRVPLGVRGRLTTERGHTVVDVNDGLTAYGARFTLAHELAHVILGTRRASLPYRRFEELCDACAEEILLPDQLLRNQLIGAHDHMLALWSLSCQASIPVDILFKRALAAGAMRPSSALWTRIGRDRVIIVDSLPRRTPEQLADTQIGAPGESILREVTAVQHPTTSRLKIFDAGIAVGTIEAWCFPVAESADVVLIVFPDAQLFANFRRQT